VSVLVWHAADGSRHAQDTQKGLQSTCGCGYRHRLGFMGEDAATAQIYPGVAHTWPAGRPCVLCRGDWRVPVGTPRQCIYCASLAGAPEALTAHRALMHA